MEIKILVSAPSDQDKEAEHAIRSIEKLNAVLEPHGHCLKALNWKQNISTGRSSRAQNVINDQTNDCDAIVAIIGPRAGTATGDYQSGTIEEIETFLSKRTGNSVDFDVHVFFNSSGVDPLDLDTDQLAVVQNYRKSLNSRGVNFGQFSTLESLSELLQLGLSTFIARNESLRSSSDPSIEDDFDEMGSDDALEYAAMDMEEVTDVIKTISQMMENFNKELNSLTNSMTDQGELADSKAIFDTAADLFLRSANELAPKSRAMRSKLASSHANLNYALTLLQQDLSESQPEQWADTIKLLRDSINPMIYGMVDGLNSMMGARDALDQLPRRRSSFIKAKKSLRRVYSDMIEVLELTIRDFRGIVSL